MNKEIILPDGWVVDKIENNKIILKEESVAYEESKYVKWNKEKNGIEIKADGEHFIISNMPTTITSNWNDAKVICEQFGGSLPTVDQLKVMHKYFNEINFCFEQFKGNKLYFSIFWSINEYISGDVFIVGLKGGNIYTDDKTNYRYVRAVLSI
jgi:hypothetical protein